MMFVLCVFFVQALKKQMTPGLRILTWNSMKIDSYVEEAQTSITRVWNLIRHINDILENRVRNNFRKIANLCLLDLPADRSFQRDEFIKTQNKAISITKKVLIEKNMEIETAINDLINDVKNFPIQDTSVVTPGYY